MNELVRTERHGRTLVVTIDRVDKRNAVNADVTAGLDAALNLLDDDPQLWVGVLTGSGGVFSAGSDLLQGSGDPTERGGVYGAVGRRRGTPLIAAVEGVAYGGGLELALACDLIVAARTARFALPETARGVVASSGALFRAPRALPVNIARELLLTGRPLDAERAYSLGLVNRLADTGDALAEALVLADLVAENAPRAQRETLLALDSIAAEEAERGWAATERAVAANRTSNDFAEGIEAFRDKRSPHWTNS
jgi:enoyl-CoA hydratase